MGGASSKAKGANGERELAALLGTWAAGANAPMKLTRNLEQVRQGGADLNGVPGLEIEVKRQEALNVSAWWRQVCDAAAKTGKHPLLAYRQNRKRWRFMTRGWVAVYTAAEPYTVPVEYEMEETNARRWFQEWVKHHVD